MQVPLKDQCFECSREATHHLCEKHYDKVLAEAHEQGYQLAVEKTQELLKKEA